MTELQEYMTTGMLGGYRPENAVLRQEGDGVNTIFRDTATSECEGGFVLERKMLIGGSASTSPPCSPATPPPHPQTKCWNSSTPS